MRRMVSAIVLFGLGATILIAAPKVQVQRDPKFDFSAAENVGHGAPTGLVT